VHRPKDLIPEARKIRSYIRESKGKGLLRNPRSNRMSHIKINLAEMVQVPGGLASTGFEGILE
jgi:hypothetical protein